MEIDREARVSLCGVFISILSYSSWLISSKCLTMAASILFVRVTRGVFADEVVGGLVTGRFANVSVRQRLVH